MAFDVGILFAIATMLSWGIADFFAKKAIDSVGYKTSLLLNHATALAPIAVCAVVFFRVPSPSALLIMITLLAGVLGMLGYVFFYRGFEKGSVSVVSPISASWSVITTLLAVVLYNERLVPLQIVGVTAVFLGVFFAATNFSQYRQSLRKGRSNGVFDGAASMVAWGFCYALLKPMSGWVGPILAICLLRAVAAATLFSWSGITKTKICLPTKWVLLLIVSAGLLDFLGFITFNLSMATDYVAVVSPIAATAPAVTIALAYFILKEKAVTNQKIGIIAILTGLILISLV